jgi:hypothetical protein
MQKDSIALAGPHAAKPKSRFAVACKFQPRQAVLNTWTSSPPKPIVVACVFAALGSASLTRLDVDRPSVNE